MGSGPRSLDRTEAENQRMNTWAGEKEKRERRRVRGFYLRRLGELRSSTAMLGLLLAPNGISFTVLPQ